MYKRVLLKLSGEALSDNSGPLNQQLVDNTVLNIIELYRKGVQIGIVVGGGNILRGRSSTCIDRSRADHMGMLSTAINSLALQDTFLKFNVPCVVLSMVDMPLICDRYTSRTAHKYLDENNVVIFACGTGSPYFSTDTGAALKAAEIGADVLLLAKNVDGIYNDDPKNNPDAIKYEHLTYDQIIADDLKATDITAITLCREQKLPIHVFALSDLPRIINENSSIGTIID